MTGGGVPRPEITYSNGKFWRNGSDVRVVIGRNRIMVGCSDVSPDAARELLKLWDSKFSPLATEEYVIQP